jgi:hypothetical protein
MQQCYVPQLRCFQTCRKRRWESQSQSHNTRGPRRVELWARASCLPAGRSCWYCCVARHVGTRTCERSAFTPSGVSLRRSAYVRYCTTPSQNISLFRDKTQLTSVALDFWFLRTLLLLLFYPTGLARPSTLIGTVRFSTGFVTPGFLIFLFCFFCFFLWFSQCGFSLFSFLFFIFIFFVLWFIFSF